MSTVLTLNVGIVFVNPLVMKSQKENNWQFWHDQGGKKSPINLMENKERQHHFTRYQVAGMAFIAYIDSSS